MRAVRETRQIIGRHAGDSRAGGALASVGFSVLLLFAIPVLGAPTDRDSASEPCPQGAIVVEPGASVQAAADRAEEGAAFCLKNGLHRSQAVRPKRGQSFHGEGRTVLNGSRLLTSFSREGRYWVASGQEQRGRKHGQCITEAPACNLPEGLFIDDEPLVQVLSKDDVEPGRFYFDHTGARIYFADDPTGRKVEATVAAFAFQSAASDVLIRNLTIEKYASVAEKGAIQAQGTTGWVVENCEVRLNSGGGIAAGSRIRVRNCNIHHNGQIGITGAGRDILIEENQVWTNNIRGFYAAWEAGGVKVASSDGVVFRGNHIHDNLGPGLWCDINCRDVLYENNVVEHNRGAGIFHEISFKAVIRNNIVRHNGGANRAWFWGDNILIAASQDVDVYGNAVTVSAGQCGIMLIDQSRPFERGENDTIARAGKYKTRNNKVHDNDTIFEGAVCAGGASDAKPGDENYTIISEGNNVFDGNIYHVPRPSGPAQFVWGHAMFDWEGLRAKGIELNGRLVLY
jgi:hypothetical protein